MSRLLLRLSRCMRFTGVREAWHGIASGTGRDGTEQSSRIPRQIYQVIDVSAVQRAPRLSSSTKSLFKF